MTKKHIWMAASAGVAAGFMIGAVSINAAGSDPAPSTKTVTAPAKTVTSQVIAPPITETVTQTAAAPPPVTVTEKPPEPSGYSDGLYLVGTDMPPGNYKSDGPRQGYDETGFCYWARLTDSARSDIIANNLTEGPTRLTAVAGEYLEISGCTFVPV